MKKMYLIAAMAVATLTANAQEKLMLSTYNGTNIEKFDGKMVDVTVNRYVFTGWNTLSLPFAMTESELNDLFGADCKLEKLVGAEQNGKNVTLMFQDCKANGVAANTPYILYYTGEAATKQIKKPALIYNEPSVLSYAIKGSDNTVTMAGVSKHDAGIGYYGVLARDNSEARFVRVDETTNGFYATRCYIQLSTNETLKLNTLHLAAGEVTAIETVAAKGSRFDVYNTQGLKVASQMNSADLHTLKSGIYVINGQKVLVK